MVRGRVRPGMASELLPACSGAEIEGSEGGKSRLAYIPFASFNRCTRHPSCQAAGSSPHCPRLQKISIELGTVVPVCNPSTGETEAGGLPEVGGDGEDI